LISWKFSHDAGNMLDNPWPLYIVIPWALVFVTCIGWYLSLRFKKDRTTIYGDLSLDSEDSLYIEKEEEFKEELKKGEGKEKKKEKEKTKEKKQK